MADISGRKSNYVKYAIFGGIGAAASVGVLLAILFFAEPEGEFAMETERLGIEENLIGDPEAPLETVIPATVVAQPEEATAGSTVRVLGTGFSSGDQVVITFNGVTADTGPEDVIVDRFARFSAEIIVPDIRTGEYDVTAMDESGNSESSTVTIVEE